MDNRLAASEHSATRSSSAVGAGVQFFHHNSTGKLRRLWLTPNEIGRFANKTLQPFHQLAVMPTAAALSKLHRHLLASFTVLARS